ncbi:MAG: hypothetical protein GC179_22230 [Anaerolineaceae bacterium]|nr:hypothetical protein [Anaerolineaceae bacterium]
MILEQVFEVMEVTLLESGYWFVGGQAQKDINVGDNLALEIKTEIDVRHFLPFQVMAISTYGHDVQELVHPLTGYLTLKGEKGGLLKTTKYLWSATDN